MRTYTPHGGAVAKGPHAAETISLLGGSNADVGGDLQRTRVTSSGRGVVSESPSSRSRTRLVGFTAGVVFALFALCALSATHDGFRGFADAKLATLGKARRSTAPAVSAAGDDDWLLGDVNDATSEPSLGQRIRRVGARGDERGGVRRASSQSLKSSGGLRNKEGGVPGLVKHVDQVTDTTRFRMISFCNQAYWPFAHGMLQSMQFEAPTLVPFWTIIVADEETKQFIRKNAPNVDVFVDTDLQDIVANADDADLGELKKLLSWRRMHALSGLINADYTAVFLEPDVVFTKNPLQLFHDMLLDADIVATSDYGFGTDAVTRVNTKVLFAKPSDEAKKLLDVWQRAEAAYRGEDSEKGFLVTEILPNADRMEAAIHVLDQNTVSNYLSHDSRSSSSPTIITGTGCDDVNYKLNWMNQIVLQVLPAGPEGVPPVDYDTVREGCDYQTRLVATKGGRKENGVEGHVRPMGGDADDGDVAVAPRQRRKRSKRASSD